MKKVHPSQGCRAVAYAAELTFSWSYCYVWDKGITQQIRIPVITVENSINISWVLCGLKSKDEKKVYMFLGLASWNLYMQVTLKTHM